MTNKRKSVDTKNTKEEEYFRKKQMEWIEKASREAQLEAERRQLLEVSGITDPAILTELQKLGYTHQTFMLLHLVPLVHVAWMSGRVTDRERDGILEAARVSGVTAVSPGYQQLMDWLDHRPPSEFFERTLRVIRHTLQTIPEEEQKIRRRDLLLNCTRVAAASAGFWGLGSKISRTEQALLNHIAAALEQ